MQYVLRIKRNNMKFRAFLVAAAVMTLSACGTLNSLDNTQNTVDIHHSQVTTQCEEISRVYSGVQYDLCLLNSKKKSSPAKLQLDPLWITSVDVLFSFVADTLALPYTIYQQYEHGNLEVTK